MVRFALHAADHRYRFAEVYLRFASRMIPITGKTPSNKRTACRQCKAWGKRVSRPGVAPVGALKWERLPFKIRKR
jgi:hypothetical protein